jgi:hypothetical protein
MSKFLYAKNLLSDTISLVGWKIILTCNIKYSDQIYNHFSEVEKYSIFLQNYKEHKII